MAGFTSAHPISTDLSQPTRVMLNDITAPRVWSDATLQYYLGGANAVDFDPEFRAFYDGSPTDYFTDGTLPDASFVWADDMRAVLSMIDTVIGIDFEEVTSEATARASADLVLVTTHFSDEANLLGICNFPGLMKRAAGDSWTLGVFNASSSYVTRDAAVGAGNMRTSLLLHELGHGLGLYHSFQGAASFSVGNTLDNERYTVMSYTGSSSSKASGHAVSMMALDIAALQQQYGVETYAEADSSYRLLAPKSAPLSLAENAVQVGQAYYCIWDSGGVDTISFGGRRSVLINLNDATLYRGGHQDATEAVADMKQTYFYSTLSEFLQYTHTDPNYTAGGFFSQVLDNFDGIWLHELGGFSIAHGVQIENAKGGSGDDFLVGNELANQLYGGKGGDALVGAAGDDSLWGGLGEDEILGGSGEDRLYGGVNVDWLYGGDGYDIIIGGADEDILTGGSGVDRFVLRSLAEAGDWVMDFSLKDIDILVVRDATLTVADLAISYETATDAGSELVEELIVYNEITGQRLWNLVDGGNLYWVMTEINGEMLNLFDWV